MTHCATPPPRSAAALLLQPPRSISSFNVRFSVGDPTSVRGRARFVDGGAWPVFPLLGRQRRRRPVKLRPGGDPRRWGEAAPVGSAAASSGTSPVSSRSSSRPRPGPPCSTSSRRTGAAPPHPGSESSPSPSTAAPASPRYPSLSSHAPAGETEEVEADR